MTKYTVILFLCLLITSGEAQQKAGTRVDLTAQIATPEAESTDPRRSAHRLLSLAERSRETRFELTLALGDIDSPAFTWGDFFTYELVLRNRSAGVLQIPYSRDFAQLQPSRIPESQLRTARLILGILDRDTGELLGTLDGLELRGSNTLPETIVRVSPGEELTLKVPAQWFANDRVVANVKARSGAVRLYATLVLADEAASASTRGVDAFVFTR